MKNRNRQTEVIIEPLPTYCLGCGERLGQPPIHAPRCDLTDQRWGTTVDANAAERVRSLLEERQRLREDLQEVS